MALAALADDLVAATPSARMGELIRELDERAASQHAPAVAGVTLASLHAATGLDWDTVFIIGCSDGFLPIVMAEGEVAIEEERRLLYVGLTRARRELHLSWAGARTPGARATRRPSRFLDATAGILGEGARSPSRRTAGADGVTGRGGGARGRGDETGPLWGSGLGDSWWGRRSRCCRKDHCSNRFRADLTPGKTRRELSSLIRLWRARRGGYPRERTTRRASAARAGPRQQGRRVGADGDHLDDDAHACASRSHLHCV